MAENIAFGIIIGTLFITLIVLFCTVIIKLYIAKIKNYTKIIYQKDIDFQKVINTTIIETQEQVLNNISQDLHDDAGQQLTYINFQLENLKLDSTALNTALLPVSESVLQLSQTIRNISYSLNNQLLSQQNLIKVIETEINRIRENGKTDIQFKKIGMVQKDFSCNEKIVIYRIFQEIINNILKHSKSTSIEVSITTNPKFEIIVTDNGKGFDYDAIKNNKLTLGLNNMIDRAIIINYKLEINSLIGTGTTVVLSEN